MNTSQHDELVIIKEAAFKKNDLIFEKLHNKTLKKVQSKLENQKVVIKNLKKRAKRGEAAVCLSKFWGYNELRDWVPGDQKHILIGISKSLDSLAKRIYGDSFHFHVSPYPNEVAPDGYDLYLCWEDFYSDSEDESSLEVEDLNEVEPSIISPSPSPQRCYFKLPIAKSDYSQLDEEDSADESMISVYSDSPSVLPSSRSPAVESHHF